MDIRTQILKMVTKKKKNVEWILELRSKLHFKKIKIIIKKYEKSTQGIA